LAAGKRQWLPLAAVLILSGFRAVAAVTYPATILADHPVAYWRLEEANGATTVADSTGNGNDGIVTYVTQSDGVTVFPRLGVPALYTNGGAFATSTGIGQGRIDVVPNSTINPPLADGTNGAPFSAECWALATTQPAGVYKVPLDDSSPFNTQFPNSAGWNFYQTPGPASTWSFSIRPNPGFIGNGAPVTVGQWAHLVLTYDGTNAVFYVNGVAFGTYAVGQYCVNDGSADMLFGSGPATGQTPFDGELDEVALYTNALSAAQVLAHYQAGTNAITPTATPPSFTSLPVSTNAYAGVPFTFASQAVGTAPLFYQWKRGATAIPNATNNNYTFTPAFPADDGVTFSVLVTNSAGSSNSPAVTLTVLTNINVLYPPFSITRRAGGYAAFRTVANGAQPITYQWHSVSNAVDRLIPGATADTLWLSNVQASLDGTMYYAVMTNPFETATGNMATLNVIARTTNAPATLYDKIVMADKPVGFWRLDETNTTASGGTALDTAGNFDGTYTFVGNDLTFDWSNGIPHEIDPSIHVTNTAVVTIPYALELNPVTGPWSVEFWLEPTSQDPVNFRTPIASEANPGNGGVNLSGWNIYQHVQSYWTWNIFNGGPNGSFTSEFVDHPVVPGQWYHMVLTDDGTNMVWYVNNRNVFSIGTSTVGFVQNGINGDPAVAGNPMTLAVRSDGAFGGWDGGIDELAVYNYVLSPQQIQNHFLNSTHINITSSGNKVVVTWPVGTLQASPNILGTYTNVNGATSPFTNSVSPALYYRVQLQ
jgi:hypothetical protein